MLKLEVYGSTTSIERVADALDAVAGVRHVAIAATGRGELSRVSADLPAEAGNEALRVLDELGIPSEDVVLVDLDRVGPTTDANDPLVLIWEDVLAQARERAHVPGRYLVLMAAAGVVAAFALLDKSPVLIVGAMAISPDLLPITAACTGVVLLRFGLAVRGILVLAAGLAVTGAIAAALTVLLDVAGRVPDGFTLGTAPAGQSHIGTSTICIAFAAGVAGMLAVEMRGSAAVGVAISVTTVPAIAFVGVAVGLGKFDKTGPALGVLGANVAMMLLGGAIALALQRRLATWRSPVAATSRRKT